MFETSIQGPLTETADPPFIAMIVECPAYEEIEGINDIGETGMIVWTETEEAEEGVIDLGNTGVIVDCSPLPAPNSNKSDSALSVSNGPAISCLSLIEPVILTGTASADVLIGAAEFDLVSGRGGDDVLRGRGAGDQISGGAGADTIMGDNGRDFIRGNSGDDVIRAGVGRDTVKGGAGADLINGGGGDDFLAGGAGDDTIIGRTGDDTLKGAAGADVFQFRTSDRNDTILDFEQGQDRIEILNGATSFIDLSIQQDGADVLITFGSGRITIISDDAGAFDANDFIF